jgi:hypothetical protein
MVAVRAGLFVGLVVVDDCACLVVEGKQISAQNSLASFTCLHSLVVGTLRRPARLGRRGESSERRTRAT